MNTILVTGANGQLGRCLQDALQASPASDTRWVFTDADILDITDRQAVSQYVEAEGVDIIINCAAYTDVEASETHPDLAYSVNACAPGILGRVMAERGGRVIHVSTDYVTGDKQLPAPIREDASAAPLGVYGASKLQGENLLLDSGANVAIIRTAWLYSEYGRNFLLTMLRLTAEKPELKVVMDQIGTPTYAADLAQAILRIAPCRDITGIFNYTDEGLCSWYDFTIAIARACGHDQCRITPCMSHEYPTRARRPAYSVLDKAKIKQTLGISIPHWHDSMMKCLNRINERNSQ